MTDKVRRRLTTLLCADAAGYTRLMGADEAGTLAMLRRRRAAMATLIERHEGRIVNTWGDAVIAEFASVVEAVQCAVEMQQELRVDEQHEGLQQKKKSEQTLLRQGRWRTSLPQCGGPYPGETIT